MKNKIVLLDSHPGYLNKLTDLLNARYPTTLEVHSLTDTGQAMRLVMEIGADLLIAGEEFGIRQADLPQTCALAFFTGAEEPPEPAEGLWISRFQKLESLATAILTICAERRPRTETGFKTQPVQEQRAVRFAAFLPCGGGSGGSTMAAACAISLREAGKDVLYVNLERYGSAHQFFRGEGMLNFSDLIFSVKNRGIGLEQKVERVIQQDETGVRFIETCRMAPDISELTGGEMHRILEALRALGRFDWILFDLDPYLDGALFEVVKGCSALILVSDGSDNSAYKTEKICRNVELIFQQEECTPPASFLLYNKYSNKTGRKVESIELPLLGGVPRFEGSSSAHLARRFAQMNLFEKLL